MSQLQFLLQTERPFGQAHQIRVRGGAAVHVPDMLAEVQAQEQPEGSLHVPAQNRAGGGPDGERGEEFSGRREAEAVVRGC